ncbi:SAM-dependent methyltransferase [Polymorphobacter sp. PAMC 29334]|uniref:class I SAM-dependent methyltransferase n=1 Tax=Polymorphobacter sp. PAMC 29334 TaxID=2862331 RepID=UPI001C75E673|nr:SAM-dependent methyltransferase [Polymorphobacter sp. PAMC 29334]QYE34869.1 SAM-dependent methyltransferase [Polymorphobacter sp. PAMC 29334]
MPNQAVERKAQSKLARQAARADLLPFLRAWIAAPLRVAAIAPSGPALARAITAEISAASMPVIEFGPGTGVFTQAILDAGVTADQLIMIEAGADFAALLRTRFPAVRIVEGSAGALHDIPLFGAGKVGAVVSGLPILSMPKPVVLAILDTAFSELRPGGAMYQFTYGFRCPVADSVLDALGLKASRTSTVLVNAPPASVYKIERK